MRGQVEAVVILAVLVIAVIIVLYLVQFAAIGPVITDPTQRLVKESAENSIRTGTLETMRTIALHGGYLQPQPNSVSLSGQAVPYWQLNGQTNIPDYRANLAEGVKTYLQNNKAVLEQSLAGREVVIQDPQQVTVSILPDKIEVTVNMPTSVRGAALPQPYRISIPSKLSEVLDFSKNFLEGQKQNRFFEYFTLASMLYSEPDGDTQKIPMLIVLSDCGKSLQKSYNDIKPEMERVIKRTIAHTYLPGKYPEGVIELTGYPKYSLTPFSGKEYSDLDVTFWVNDGFSLNQNTFQFSPEPIIAVAKPIPLTGSCQSEPLYVQYSMNYPIIARVTDTLTGIPLQFAFNILIINNEVTPYENLPQLGPFHCENPQCTMDLTVLDSSGQPVDSAFVSFLGCGIGETIAGRLQARVPCGLGPLYVTKDRYSPYFATHSPDELASKQITLQKRPLINLKFWEVNVRKESPPEPPQYRIKPGVGRDSDITEVSDNLIVSLILISETSGFQFAPLYYDSKGGVLDMPAGSYTVQGVLFDKDFTKAFGSFITILDITEGLDGRELNIYLPYTIAYADYQTDEERFTGALILTNLLQSCNLGPIRPTAVTDFPASCVKQESELLA